MNDRPTAVELVEAARHYLEAELLPNLTDARQRFQTLVAANVLAIAGRELASEEGQLREEWDLLAGLVSADGQRPEGLAALREAVRQGNARLCERIRGGDFDDPARSRAAAAVARELVVRKLEIANPRYLAALRGDARPAQAGRLAATLNSASSGPNAHP
jgi:hypothetical protein